MASREPPKNVVMSILKSERINRRLLLITAIACRNAYSDWDLASVLAVASDAPALGNDGRRSARQFRL